MYKPSGNLRRDYERLSGEYMKQKDRILSYQEQITSLRNSNRALEKALAKEKEQHKEESAQKDAGIRTLKNKAAHLEALANRDGTNTGMPTSQIPASRKKVIPNSRRGSNKKKGGQLGHKNTFWNLSVTLRLMNRSCMDRIPGLKHAAYAAAVLRLLVTMLKKTSSM